MVRVTPSPGDGCPPLPPGPAAALEAPPGDEDERLDDDPGRHLRPAQRAVTELDGHLGQDPARPGDLVGHLDLEAVAVGPYGGEIDAFQGPAVVGPVARGGVTGGQAQHDPGVDVAGPGDRPPLPGPVGDLPAGHVAGPDGDVGP